MLTVVAAAAIGRGCTAGNKADVESGSSRSSSTVVVVGEYSIIELCIRVAMMSKTFKLQVCDGQVPAF